MSRIVAGNAAVASAVLLHGDGVNDAELQAAISLSLESIGIDDNTVHGEDADDVDENASMSSSQQRAWKVFQLISSPSTKLSKRIFLIMKTIFFINLAIRKNGKQNQETLSGRTICSQMLTSRRQSRLFLQRCEYTFLCISVPFQICFSVYKYYFYVHALFVCILFCQCLDEV